MINFLASGWQQVLENEIRQPYFAKLLSEVQNEYDQAEVCPPMHQVFNALNLCSFDQTRVVIIGQDPYHGIGQAHGLCFSVNEQVKVPPSLKNIFKELESDVENFKSPVSGNLEGWARQGVLLLNAVLTVRAGIPGSHARIGWERFTDAIISTLSEKKQHLVFMLWGNYAAKKSGLIDQSKHLVLQAAHPSPLARGAFFGNKHFSACNRYLTTHGLGQINWQLHR